MSYGYIFINFFETNYCRISYTVLLLLLVIHSFLDAIETPWPWACFYHRRVNFQLASAMSSQAVIDYLTKQIFIEKNIVWTSSTRLSIRELTFHFSRQGDISVAQPRFKNSCQRREKVCRLSSDVFLGKTLTIYLYQWTRYIPCRCSVPITNVFCNVPNMWRSPSTSKAL